MAEDIKQVDSTQEEEKRSIVRTLIIISLLMFAFGYALVPLYEAFCRITGFGGKTDIIQESVAANAELVDRNIAVTFTSHSHTALPWEFKPVTKGLDVKVGEVQDAVFYVKNYSNRPITGMATFNVTPPRAGFYFKKTECFCFTKQVLQPGEEQEMAVRFLLDSDMPDDVHELTLSYTFFDNDKHAGQ